MRMWIGWIALTVLAMPLAAAEVYKVVDSQGRVTYTDSPPKDGRDYEKVELKALNRQQAIEPVPSLAPPRGLNTRDNNNAEEPISYVVEIASPPEGAQVPPGQRDLPVAARVSPPLAQDHALLFMLNGEPLTEPTRETGLVIEEIYRGEHQLSVQVLNQDGEVIQQSAPVTVYVHRPTLNSPARN